MQGLAIILTFGHQVVLKEPTILILVQYKVF